MQKYLEYAKTFNASEEVLYWVSHNLANYLKSNVESQDAIEHIIDYLNSDDAPKRLQKMAYPEAKSNAEKWVKAQSKKGEHIKETEKDTETVLDFKDGFKIVKLVGENAYKREGYLMRHCVASYYGKNAKIYSLRDESNMPHCTMEENQQVKGKGNGDIHPKYVGYVVKFLEHIGMTVGDNEMAHLGYVNIEKILPDIDKDINKILYNKKYLPTNKKDEIKVNGKPKVDLDMLDLFPLIEDTETSIKVAWDIPLLVTASIEFIRKTIKKASKSKKSGEDIQAGGYSSKLAGGDYSKLAGGNSSKLAGGYSSKLAGGNSSQLAGGYYSKLAGGNSSQLAGGYSSKLAGGDYSKLAGGNSSQLAGGYSSKLAGGNSSQLAGGNSSQLAGGYSSKLAGGDYSLMIGDNKSICKGGMGAVMVLVEREESYPYKIIDYKAEQVDGKIIKEDTWYKLVKGEFTEVV